MALGMSELSRRMEVAVHGAADGRESSFGGRGAVFSRGKQVRPGIAARMASKAYIDAIMRAFCALELAEGVKNDRRQS